MKDVQTTQEYGNIILGIVFASIWIKKQAPFIIAHSELWTLTVLSHSLVKILEPHNLPAQRPLHALTLGDPEHGVVTQLPLLIAPVLAVGGVGLLGAVWGVWLYFVGGAVFHTEEG